MVILSSYFLENRAQRELDALATRDANGNSVILPVWHGVGFGEVREHSLTLADRTAVSTTKGLEYAVQRSWKRQSKFNRGTYHEAGQTRDN